MPKQEIQLSVYNCPKGHRFATLTDHPTEIDSNLPLCVHCAKADLLKLEYPDTKHNKVVSKEESLSLFSRANTMLNKLRAYRSSDLQKEIHSVITKLL